LPAGSAQAAKDVEGVQKPRSVVDRLLLERPVAGDAVTDAREKADILRMALDAVEGKRLEDAPVAPLDADQLAGLGHAEAGIRLRWPPDDPEGQAVHRQFPVYAAERPRRRPPFLDLRAHDQHGRAAGRQEAEDFKNEAMPLGGLDRLQAQSQEQVSSVSRIPLVKASARSASTPPWPLGERQWGNS
jgi:hypothetical protein